MSQLKLYMAKNIYPKAILIIIDIQLYYKQKMSLMVVDFKKLKFARNPPTLY